MEFESDCLLVICTQPYSKVINFSCGFAAWKLTEQNGEHQHCAYCRWR